MRENATFTREFLQFLRQQCESEHQTKICSLPAQNRFCRKTKRAVLPQRESEFHPKRFLPSRRIFEENPNGWCFPNAKASKKRKFIARPARFPQTAKCHCSHCNVHRLFRRLRESCFGNTIPYFTAQSALCNTLSFRPAFRDALSSA